MINPNGQGEKTVKGGKYHQSDPNALLMTIPDAKHLLAGATYYGPFEEPDTRLYEKDNRWYRVKIPCLACLGVTEYDDISPIVEVTEVEPGE